MVIFDVLHTLGRHFICIPASLISPSQTLILVQRVIMDATPNAGKTIDNIKSHTTVERVLHLGERFLRLHRYLLDKFDQFKNIDGRSRITIGNHEDDSDEGFSQYMSFFGLSKTYYAFTYGNARVIVMDSDHSSYSSGSSQYNFVISESQSAAQNSNIKWIIVYLHKQMYTSPNECIPAHVQTPALMRRILETSIIQNLSSMALMWY